MIQENIKNELKRAMLAKDSVRVTVLRDLIARFTNELVAKGRKPQEILGDDDCLTVIKRAVKQRKDSIEQFRAGGRNDLVEAEQAELKILEEYLPKMMSHDEIKVIAEKKKTEMGVTDKSKMGVLIGAVMKETKGSADGADVKVVVEELLK
jgi:uncharacterized protein YqeY